MHDFRYVTKKQAQPIKDELYQILYMVQDLVRDNFTFSFTPIGSSSRNMITCDAKSNIGFDFDINIEVNDDNEDFEPTNTESLYTANDLVKALQDGNESDYNTAYDDMLSAKAVSLIMQAEADNKELTADEAEEKAESSIKSAITKVLKPLMRKLYKTDKKKFNEMRKKIIKKFGYTSKQIAKWLTSEE